MILLAAVLFSIYAIAFSIACVKPINDDSNVTSMIYYLNVAEKYPNPESYSLALTKALHSESIMTDQVAQQIYSLSVVATKKYRRVSWAIYGLALSIISSIVLLFLFVCRMAP